MILRGKVFISTVSSHKSIEIRNILEPMGATILDFPMTEIETVDPTSDTKFILSEIEKFNWIIFSSRNGVIHFHKTLKKTVNIEVIPDQIKIAVVGVKTASELEKTGRNANFEGKGNSAGDLVDELLQMELMKNCNILLPLGNLAPPTIEKMLTGISNVTRINVYNTIKTAPEEDDTVRRIKEDRYDLVLFTSPSGVINFVSVIGDQIIKSSLRAASIGNITTKALKESGLTCMITASKSTYEGLANEIVNYYTINHNISF